MVYICERVNGKKNLYEGTENCKLKIGDKVRKIIKGNIFSKGYIQRFYDEIFIITDVKFVECPIYFIRPIHELNRNIQNSQTQIINNEDMLRAGRASPWFYENELFKISS